MGTCICGYSIIGVRGHFWRLTVQWRVVYSWEVIQDHDRWHLVFCKISRTRSFSARSSPWPISWQTRESLVARQWETAEISLDE